MIITIHQPEHQPWLGFFNKISKAEVFVILDNVQFRKNYFQNRNRILGTNGVQFVNVPTKTKGHMNCTLAETEISIEGGNSRWREKYIRTLIMSYSKYPFFNEVFPVIEKSISLETDKLCDINISIIKAFCEKLDICPNFIRASDMSFDGTKSDLILDICKKLNADTYISGPSGRDYLDVNSFEAKGIRICYNDYKHPIYKQIRSEKFISNLASLDLFMNYGWNMGKTIMMKDNESLTFE